jgi:stalled ribosome alternative rescue factor ArfA
MKRELRLQKVEPMNGFKRKLLVLRLILSATDLLSAFCGNELFRVRVNLDKRGTAAYLKEHRKLFEELLKNFETLKGSPWKYLLDCDVLMQEVTKELIVFRANEDEKLFLSTSTDSSIRDLAKIRWG